MTQPAAVHCPFCGSADTEKQADFGTSLMVRLHFCHACRTAFEAVKWGDTEGLDLPAFLRPRGESDVAPGQGEAGTGEREP